jgi:hypothetical protein
MFEYPNASRAIQMFCFCLFTQIPLTFSRNIEVLTQIKFDDWLSRMTMLCSRDNYYNIREVGYNYNRFLSEDIIESEKITKNFNLNKENSDTDSTNVSNGDSKKSNTSNSKKFITGVFGNKIKRNKINF